MAGAGVRDVVVRPIFADEVGRFKAALPEHHWLERRLTGQVLHYVAVLGGEWVAVAGFGSAVLACRARDEFLGWSREQQYARLKHVADNQRFCVLPAGPAAELASAVLSRVLARLSGDYLAAYGHRVLAVETFTDPVRHTGACICGREQRAHDRQQQDRHRGVLTGEDELFGEELDTHALNGQLTHDATDRVG
ncbi:MAG: Druantia anti-phage system protein DruA [Pseudonocardiaceae bacterium]